MCYFLGSAIMIGVFCLVFLTSNPLAIPISVFIAGLLMCLMFLYPFIEEMFGFSLFPMITMVVSILIIIGGLWIRLYMNF